MRYANLALMILVTLVSWITLPGCGNDGNTVIEHSGQEATAEDMADYEAEMKEMEAEGR